VQHILERLVTGLLGQLHVALGAAISVAPLVVEDASTQRLVGRLLIALGDGRVDSQAARVHLVRIAVVEHLADHFGDVLPVDGEVVEVAAYHQGLRLGHLVLLVGDISELTHAAQHIELALLGTARVHHRIEGRGGLGKPRQHGGLRDAHVR
jgi:hypothetical protein